MIVRGGNRHRTPGLNVAKVHGKFEPGIVERGADPVRG